MTILNVVDANTGDIVAIDLDNPTGSIHMIDQDTGDIVLLDLENPTGVITFVDADTGEFVDVDFSNPTDSLSMSDADTGDISEFDLGNQVGTIHVVDANTGDIVEVNFDDLIFGGNTKAPNEVTGLTGWWEAFDPSTLFTDAGTTSVSADSQAVYQMNDKSGANHHFSQATLGNRPLYKVNRQNGKSGLLFDGLNDYMDGAVLNQLVTASTKTVIVAAKITGGFASGNSVILADVGTYVMFDVQADNHLAVRNWDGDYDITPGHPFVNGVAFVFTFVHAGGNIFDRLNSSPLSAGVPSGNTTNLGNAVRLFDSGAGLYISGDFYGMATYNVDVSDEDRNAVILYFMEQLGIS